MLYFLFFILLLRLQVQMFQLYNKWYDLFKKCVIETVAMCAINPIPKQSTTFLATYIH